MITHVRTVKSEKKLMGKFRKTLENEGGEREMNDSKKGVRRNETNLKRTRKGEENQRKKD